MYTLRVRDHFDAAHYIKDYPGKCARDHGHRWEVEVHVQGMLLDDLEMLVDFTVVKKVLKNLLDHVDHYPLNVQFDEPHVTAEYLARWFFGELNKGGGFQVVKVVIWEGPDCCVEYVHESS